MSDVQPIKQSFVRTSGASLLSALLAFLLLTAGCSNDQLPTYPVTGHVVFEDGAPVKTGVIEFRSIDHGLNARGEIQRDGSFQLGTYGGNDGAVAGRHQAIVVQFLAIDSHPDVQHDHGDPVDRKFADYEASRLEFEISADSENALRIVVEKQAD